ncbi:MAG: hypothetical protein KKG99_03525 [Bacteroidetes bacterium]|nr:hypothetical protein [Bacteroidota bacterium]
MADYCNICTSQLLYRDLESTDVHDVMKDYRLLSGSDININEIFNKAIKPEMEDFLSNENLVLEIGGICEYCGLVRLSVEKKNDIIYLVAWCFKYDENKNDRLGKYYIAIINNNELDYQENEIIKYYEE